MKDVVLYRRRYIPDEKILLKDDIILKIDDDVVVTKWNVLTKRHDFTHGVSCYYIKQGFKVSKFIDDDGRILYWYCDIIDTDYDSESNTYTFNDLLVDVIVYPDGFVKVVDTDEVAIALRSNILPPEKVAVIMERLNSLLNIIYDGNFDKYKSEIADIQ